MRSIKSGPNLLNVKSFHRYRFLSLYELIQLIAIEGNRQALIEFHNRPLFTYKGESSLRCTEFIDRLRKEFSLFAKGIANSFEIADRAYDLTIDKFSNLFSEQETENGFETGKNKLKQNGPHCRLYFKPVLLGLEKSFKKSKIKGQLEIETLTVAAVQGFIRRHFRFSVLEAQRKANPLWSRYNWNTDSCRICVWLPKHLKGSERQKWLERNINVPDPTKPGERQRIQSLIYSKLGNMKIIPLNEEAYIIAMEDSEDGLHRNMDECESLGEIVAKEKVANIAHQRRTIQNLGKHKLAQMVLHIFESIGYNEYKDNAVASAFGLSKATFSRFAGSRWTGTNQRIPDLWLNTAKVLSSHPDFKEAAKQAGVWEQVELVLNKDKKKGTDNE